MRHITNGWLLDICHIKDRMILWIKQKKGDVKRLEYPWLPSLYVASDLKKDLSALLDDNRILSDPSKFDKFLCILYNPSGYSSFSYRNACSGDISTLYKR